MADAGVLISGRFHSDGVTCHAPAVRLLKNVGSHLRFAEYRGMESGLVSEVVSVRRTLEVLEVRFQRPRRFRQTFALAGDSPPS